MLPRWAQWVSCPQDASSVAKCISVGSKQYIHFYVPMSVRCDYPNTQVKNLQLPTTCDVTGYTEMLPEPQDAAG